MQIEQLFHLILDRHQHPRLNSYTNQLFDKGEDAILQKIGEEAVEVILAAKSQGNQRLVEEISDLVYHTLVLLAERNLTLADIEAELERRHQEKQAKKS
jgi:phosphoribosyl-ATP pyrophosphohydrolase